MFPLSSKIDDPSKFLKNYHEGRKHYSMFSDALFQDLINVPGMQTVMEWSPKITKLIEEQKIDSQNSRKVSHGSHW